MACSVGILQKKRRTTEKKALAYRPKGGQNTDIAFLALRLRVVLDPLNLEASKTLSLYLLYIMKAFQSLKTCLD